MNRYEKWDGGGCSDTLVKLEKNSNTSNVDKRLVKGK